MRFSARIRSLSRTVPLTAFFACGLLFSQGCASNNKDPDPVVDTGADSGPPVCPNPKSPKLASPPTCSQSPNIGNPCSFESVRKIQYICNLGNCPADGCTQSNFTDVNPTYSYWCCEK